MRIEVTDEQVYEKLCQQVDGMAEVMAFAKKRDKLDLYLAAEVDHAVLTRAAEIVRKYIDGLKPIGGSR
jgi:hypothetical protein